MKLLFSLAFSLCSFLLIRSPLAAQDTIHFQKFIGNLRTIDVNIENEPLRFLFDTGGGETFVSPEVAQKAHRLVYGAFTGFRMTGEAVKAIKCDSLRFSVGKTSIGPVTVLVWDIMSVLPDDLPKISGILSLKSFIGKKVELNLKDEILIIETNKSFERKIIPARPIKARFANGLFGNELNLFLQIEKDKPYWFLFDSGNIDQIIISTNTAEEWGVAGDTTGQGTQAKETEIEFGQRHAMIPFRIGDIIYDGVLDYRFIAEHIFLLDLGECRVWIR